MSDFDKLKMFIAKQKHVRLVYLFGSRSREMQGPLSDIDIAVYLDARLNKVERLRLRLELIDSMSSILKTDKLDLVIMNDSPPTLNYEIIKHGKVLYMNDPGERVDVESGILSRYLDRRYYERRSLDAFLQKVLERGTL